MGTSDGELIECSTLAERIAQGSIPIDEALSIARQIAEALEAVHEVGIIHRDLKPANIKIRPVGVVKVLDFGLAKALEPWYQVVSDASARIRSASFKACWLLAIGPPMMSRKSGAKSP
jgi:serine/threonine protein kinase